MTTVPTTRPLAPAEARTLGRHIRTAWEIYAAKELGLSAGEALAQFDAWQDAS